MSATIALGYGNLNESSTFSGGDWSREPEDYLHEWSLAQYAEATTNDAADTLFDMDHGSAKAAQVLVIPAHNLTSAATIQVTRGTTSGGAEVYDSTELAAWPFTPLDGNHNGAAFAIVVVFAAANTARYTRVAIDDSARDAGTKVRISRPFIGPLFVPWINPVELADDWMPSLSTVDRTESGADWVHKRAPLRRQALVYQGLTIAEGAVLKEIVRLHDTASEVVYVPSLTDRERQQRDGFVGLLQQLPRLQYPFWRHAGVALGIDQRGGAP